MTETDVHRDALENQFGLADRVVDPDALDNSIDRFRERGIVLPTFAQLADPSSFDQAGRVGDADPQGPDARNLWRVHWYNDLAGARVDVPAATPNGMVRSARKNSRLSSRQSSSSRLSDLASRDTPPPSWKL